MFFARQMYILSSGPKPFVYILADDIHKLDARAGIPMACLRQNINFLNLPSIHKKLFILSRKIFSTISLGPDLMSNTKILLTSPA